MDCPTMCDHDCTSGCHEWHQPAWKRHRQPEHLPELHRKQLRDRSLMPHVGELTGEHRGEHPDDCTCGEQA